MICWLKSFLSRLKARLALPNDLFRVLWQLIWSKCPFGALWLLLHKSTPGTVSGRMRGRFLCVLEMLFVIQTSLRHRRPTEFTSLTNKLELLATPHFCSNLDLKRKFMNKMCPAWHLQRAHARISGFRLPGMGTLPFGLVNSFRH